MTNISKSLFIDEIEKAEPLRKFSMPHFISFKGDGDPERHLKYYRNVMILYWNNNAHMCKIFTTTLQDEVKKFDHLFNIKNNPKESLRDYVKRFKAEKVKIVECNDSIASAAFQKGLLVDHLQFEELIMKEDLILADSFSLVEKHALWDEAQRADKALE
ncbi:uncharacterized protein LOC125472283 [Pyrus x bretschneideri]|uniref:uncharacterized protein LOC125472283 n=1 Tax=Pyrus x bretschneideri TaxID=225117 RepID=UPI00202EF5A3|nr:uncharacterized protein LOC125472283 [Pyrus x bretschneideri]